MEQFDAGLALRVDQYIEELFVGPDPVLSANLADAEAAGMPAIQVSPNQGRLLYLLAKMVRARRILEIGTLGGYSTTWLARALPSSGGKVVTLELNPKHVQVAARNLERAGVHQLVEIVCGDAAAALQSMTQSGEEPFDLVFIDGDKPSYVKYLELVLKLSKPGTLILADNVIRNGRVISPPVDDENARAVQHYLRTLAAHPDLESIALPLLRDKLDGLAISLVR